MSQGHCRDTAKRAGVSPAAVQGPYVLPRDPPGSASGRGKTATMTAPALCSRPVQIPTAGRGTQTSLPSKAASMWSRAARPQQDPQRNHRGQTSATPVERLAPAGHLPPAKTHLRPLHLRSHTTNHAMITTTETPTPKTPAHSPQPRSRPKNPSRPTQPKYRHNANTQVTAPPTRQRENPQKQRPGNVTSRRPRWAYGQGAVSPSHQAAATRADAGGDRPAGPGRERGDGGRH